MRLCPQSYNATTVAALPRMLSIALLVVSLVGMQASITYGGTREIVNCDGYPCVNFSFGANVSRDGDLFASTFFNPPYLSAGLQPLGGGTLTLKRKDVIRKVATFQSRKVTRKWPFADIKASDPDFNGLLVHVRAFCPSALDDVVSTSLPIALAEITVSNSSADEKTCELRFEASEFLKQTAQELRTDSAAGLFADRSFVAWEGQHRLDASTKVISTPLAVPAGGTAKRRLIIGRWDDQYPCSARLTSIQHLAEFAAKNWDGLLASTQRLEAQLPKSGDEQLDAFLRWYTTAGVAMTRVQKDGTALTMGYHELNQRDSYWTSWVHLVLWPGTEKRMIRESVWGQRLDGKIPTTILPVIERDDDCDINCFFILRGLRYVRFHKDVEFGRQILPALERAAEWLHTRCNARTGLPEGSSYWFDWKDVPQMSNRKYSPYTSMLYVAAMQRLAEFCEDVAEQKSASRYRDRARLARQNLLKRMDDGGLYNGQFFEHVWHVGKRPSGPRRASQDQVVGVLFDVITPKQSQSMLTALSKSINQWGARETYPFFPKELGYSEGDYHNGGIWPYMNHVHAWALLKAGRREEAIDLLKRVARADLEKAGDFIPHEYVHGKTGEQAGVPMQGWNAAMFGTLYFGLEKKPVP